MNEVFNIVNKEIGNDPFVIWVQYVDFIDLLIRTELSDQFKEMYKDKFNWSRISMDPN